MGFCTNCGTKLEADQTTCPKCGKERTQPENVQPKHKSSFVISKKVKIWTVFMVGLVVLCFIGYQIGAVYTGKAAAVKQFKQALIHKDANALLKWVSVKHSTMRINKKSVKSLFGYLDKNPQVIDEILDNIEQQSAAMDSKPKSVAVASSTSSGMFTLKKNGKKWLLFNDYKFEVSPYYIEVDTNYKGTKILVDGKVSGEAKEDNNTVKVGPFFPGNHKVEGVWKGDYATVEDAVDVPLAGPNHTIALSSDDLNLEGEMIYPQSNFPEAKFFVNGKDTGQTFDNIDDFGPVSLNGTVRVYAEMDFPWGKAKSKELTLGKDNDGVDLEIDPITDDVKKQIVETVNQYAKEWADAYRNLDPSKLKHVTSNAFNDIKQDINNMKEIKEKWKGNPVKTLIDLDNIDVSKEESGYRAEIEASLQYNATYYNEGEDAQTELSDNNRLLYLLYDSSKGTWLVDETNELWGFSADHPQETKF